MYRTPTTGAQHAQSVLESNLDFDLSRSLKVKYDGAIGLPMYGFLLIFNSNIWS